jgi:hypothetical protein
MWFKNQCLNNIFKYICYITLKGGTANDGPILASAWRQVKMRSLIGKLNTSQTHNMSANSSSI